MAVEDRAVVVWFEVYLVGFINNDLAGAIRGCANYGAALMLLCYTEYLGGIRTGQLGKSGKAEKNFNAGLAILDEVAASEREGADSHYYSTFPVKLNGQATNLYDVLRCGLVHEYFGKGTVKVVNNPEDPAGVSMPGTEGVRWDRETGELIFDVNGYFKHFRAAVEHLRAAVLADTESTGARANFEKATAALDKTITP